MQVGGSAPPSHCSGVSESESRSGGIQRLSPTADVGQAPAATPARRRPEHVPSPGNNAGRTRPKTSCCCYRCCFCWRCQCNGLAAYFNSDIFMSETDLKKNDEIQITNVKNVKTGLKFVKKSFYIYTVSQKTSHYNIVHKFAEC